MPFKPWIRNISPLAWMLRAPANQIGDPAMTVWIYVDTSKNVGDKDHLKVFANQHAADEWFKKHDVAGTAFGYEIMSPDMKPHVAQAYKDACDNLIYLKKEQFQVTYYTWLLLAALFILSRV